MASLEPGTPVEFLDGAIDKLAFPPPIGGEAFIAVHGQALKAPRSALTLVAFVRDEEISWVGAVDEQMLRSRDAEPRPGVRASLKERIGMGDRVWQVVAPGLLTAPGVPRPLLTIYDGERPWVILGELAAGSAIAAPLNDARGNPKWWAPEVAPPALDIQGGKRSQIELAHVWAIEPTGPIIGRVHATRGLQRAVESYLGG